MTKELFEKHLRQLELEQGIDLTVYNNGYFNFASNDNKIYRSFGGGFEGEFSQVQGLGANILFHELYRILESKEPELNASNVPIQMKIPLHQNLFNDKVFSNINNNFPMQILTESDVVKLKELIQEFWNEDVSPFFQYWSDIRTFLPFLESSNTKTWVQVLSSKTIESKMIIWKLCNHPDYSSFVEERSEIIVQALKKQPENKRYLEVLDSINALDKKMEDIDPIYPWDNSYLNPKPFKGKTPVIL